ncbi:hypothetical protein B0H13DRAFT_1904890 [Mycena leptocephala]|nr:hypothetical protein B0H13DRAFT_1904890 [Mycena leptocephala]
MLSRLSFPVATVLAWRPIISWPMYPSQTLATATPQGYPITPPDSLQCCDAVLQSTSPAVIVVCSVFGVDVTQFPTPIPVGLSCSLVDVIGENCGGVLVNCDTPDPAWGGVFALNCIPVTL